MQKSIWPNKDTKIFISMAIKPGNTGAKLHNSLYKLLKLNNIYLPLKVENAQIARSLLKNLYFAGCSLSMPFKENLISSIDKLDRKASEIGSVNTIIKKNCKLVGYNTDYYAAKEILKKANLHKDSKVLILGFGGVAKAILKALKDLKYKNIIVTARKKRNFKTLAICKNVEFCNWRNKNTIKPNFLINATPLGMFGDYQNKCPVNEKSLKNVKAVYDLPVNSNKNLLLKLCIKHNIRYFSGIYSSYLQGIRQFELYNNIKLTKKILKKIGIKV